MSRNRQDEWIESSQDDGPAIPLPSEIPQKIDLSHLPLPVLRSGSIEALIAQNEDLMARLNVTLRRLALIEEENICLKTDKQHLEQQIQNLSDQFLIHEKKDEYWKQHLLEAQEQALKHQREAESTKAELTLVEMRFAELYSASESCEDEFNQKLEWARRRLVRHQKYRARIYQLTQKMRRDFKTLQSRLEEQLLSNQDQKERLQGLVDHIQNQSRDHQIIVQDTREAYESKLHELHKQLTQLQNALAESRERNDVLDQLVVDQVELENRAIFAERKLTELEAKYQTETHRLEEDYLELRKISDLVSREREDLFVAHATSEARAEQFKGETFRLREQVENLQSLWDESRRRLEQMNVKEQALQKLNQELSTQLNQMRRELQAQKDTQAVDAKNRATKNFDSTLEWLEETDQKLARIEVGYSAPGDVLTGE